MKRSTKSSKNHAAPAMRPAQRDAPRPSTGVRGGGKKKRKILVVNVGGTHVKILATGQRARASSTPGSRSHPS